MRNRSEKAYLSYYVDEKWQRIVLQEDYTESAGVLAFEYLGQIMPSIFLNHYALSFHGVLMEYQGKGIIISAESGTGKTTHARLWRELENALIVNGDCATVQKKENIWTGFGIPWSGTSGEQVNRRNPLKALVVLERHAENEAHRISGIEALSAILPHVKYPAWDKILTNKMFDLLEKFLCEIPIIRLRCRPDGEAVKVLKKALEEL